MGKKKSWFLAIKRFFTHIDGSDKKGSKGKKRKGIFGRTKSKSLIPIFREPSSIEKILGEADELLIMPTVTNTASSTATTDNAVDTTAAATVTTNAFSSTPPVLPTKPVSTVAPPPSPPSRLRASLSRALSSSSSSSKATTENSKEMRNDPRLELTLRDQHVSATKIQAAFRGYKARRSLRAGRGIARLREVASGPSVKRQTANAMKQFQVMMRVQMQIQARRIGTLEGQRHDYTNRNKEFDGTLSKSSNRPYENEDWDDSLLSKEQVEARLQKKVEAVMKRERAMAYSYSHKLSSDYPKWAHGPLDARSSGSPWWWGWLDRQLPRKAPSTPPPRAAPSSEHQPRHHLDSSPIPRPLSSTGTAVGPTRLVHPCTPIEMLNDSDSLASCPLFTFPRYMAPTASTRAKARLSSDPRERLTGTPRSRPSSRRLSFPLTPNSRSGLGKHDDLARSVGEFSAGSAVSMPAVVGRKPFNRFV